MSQHPSRQISGLHFPRTRSLHPTWGPARQSSALDLLGCYHCSCSSGAAALPRNPPTRRCAWSWLGLPRKRQPDHRLQRNPSAGQEGCLIAGRVPQKPGGARQGSPRLWLILLPDGETEAQGGAVICSDWQMGSSGGGTPSSLEFGERSSWRA